MKDNILLANVIDYNKQKHFAFLNYQKFPINLEYERILCARYMKVSRIKKRLLWLVSHRKYLYFCTFTFDDKLITRTTERKRDIIKESFMGFDSDICFILNVDYGKNTEREHYHCIIGTDNNGDLRNFINTNYPCRSGVTRINSSADDLKRLSKYINKLTNHTTKDTTYNKRIVYNFKGFDSLPKDESKFYIYLYSRIYGLS